MFTLKNKTDKYPHLYITLRGSRLGTTKMKMEFMLASYKRFN